MKIKTSHYIIIGLIAVIIIAGGYGGYDYIKSLKEDNKELQDTRDNNNEQITNLQLDVQNLNNSLEIADEAVVNAKARLVVIQKDNTIIIKKYENILKAYNNLTDSGKWSFFFTTIHE